MGMAPSVIEAVVGLNLEWAHNEMFNSRGRRRHASGRHDRIRVATAHVFRFRRLTDTRWCTKGTLTGQSLARELAKTDKPSSMLHFHGFERMTFEIRKFAAATIIASNVPEKGLRVGVGRRPLVP